LSESINILPAENLGKVVQIIHQKMPNLAQNVLDEIEIDIDALDGSTLRHLQRYIKSVLHKQPRKKRGISSKQSTEVSNKSINEVKQKLRDLTEKSSVFSKSGLGKNGEENDDVDVDDGEHKTYPTVLIEKEKRSSSSSSSSDSSTSSDSGSSSSSSSESDSNKKKKDKRSKLVKMEGANLSDEKSKNLGLANTILSVPVVAHSKNPSNSDKGPFQESKDDALSSPVEKKPEEITSTQLEEPPAILQTTTQLKDIELKHLDSWTKMDWSGSAQTDKNKDETWSQFQNKDQLNKLREKEREERERKEKVEREIERKKQEEQRLKEMAEAEEKKRREEEEERQRQQRELLAKRESERKARQQASSQRTLMDQSFMMASFESSVSIEDQPSILGTLKFKEVEVTENKEEKRENREDGEL